MPPSPPVQLRDLLLSLFGSTRHLHTFIWSFYGDSLLHHLNESAPAMTYTTELVRLLESKGLIDDTLFSHLRTERPGRLTDINRVAALFLA